MPVKTIIMLCYIVAAVLAVIAAIVPAAQGKLLCIAVALVALGLAITAAQ